MDAHYLATPPPPCSLCTGPVGPDSAIDICGDCKFLLLEDLDSPRPRTTSSHHLLHAISVLNQPVPPPRVRHSPSGSRRWPPVLSDSESEGFGSIDSEGEPNPGFGRYRFPFADVDAGSLSAFGVESDASVDGNSSSVFEARRVFVQHGDDSIVDSDDDSLDPMHAGLSQWDSDDPDQEEEDDDDDDEWEEADNDYGASGSVEASVRVRLRNFLISSEPDVPAEDRTMLRAHSSALRRLTYWQFRRRQMYGRAAFADTESLSAGGFDELLEHLAETDNSRRGAPPAAVSFVDTLPRLTITENHERLDGLACAVCKDVFATGTEVNQLPCHHLYHPSCILPWLRSRNTCPLCRYELPIEDDDYEERKGNSSRGIRVSANEDAFSYTSDGADAYEARELDLPVNELPGPDAEPDISSSGGERNGRRWIFLAAPIVGLVGIVIAFWLGNPAGSAGATRRCSFTARAPHQMVVPQSSPANQRADRSRRWWSLF